MCSDACHCVVCLGMLESVQLYCEACLSLCCMLRDALSMCCMFRDAGQSVELYCEASLPAE